VENRATSTGNPQNPPKVKILLPEPYAQSRRKMLARLCEPTHEDCRKETVVAKFTPIDAAPVPRLPKRRLIGLCTGQTTTKLPAKSWRGWLFPRLEF
jgi:hypothetical protein